MQNTIIGLTNQIATAPRRAERSKKMKEITFNEYLEDVLGIDWNYFDNNYGSVESDRIWEEYLEYIEEE